MREISRFEKLLLLMGFLLVIAIFLLAFVLMFKGGVCALNPVEYAVNKGLLAPSLPSIVP